MPAPLDPAFLKQTRYSVHTGGGGVVYGSSTMEKVANPLPKDAEASAETGGGIIGKNVGGISKGWKPMPASYGAPGFVSKGLAASPYYVDYGPVLGSGASVAQMSYTVPAWPTGIGRRGNADGVLGEFEPEWPADAVHRSIGGHESFPAASSREMLN